MNTVRDVALLIPPIRRLYDAFRALLEEKQVLLAKLAACEASAGGEQSPFHHYNTCFDPVSVISRHAVPNLLPRPGYLTNCLGVLIDPKFFPTILAGRAGEVEAPPMPANWHADIAEWGAALRAVDLAQDSFTMIELGCGWGCWMNNTGVAARRCGHDVHLIGVEGDEGHLAFAREACAINGFEPDQVSLHRGIAAAKGGTALFPRQERAGVAWGLEPIFDSNATQREEALRSGDYEALPMITLAELVAPHSRIDLLHIDIQGGEFDFIRGSLPTLREKVSYVVVGTHSRQIEGQLFDVFLRAGWHLDIERPAILSVSPELPTVIVDGVQAWRNPGLLPAASPG